MMTETERAQLLEFGAELSGVLESPWEPRTISRAFASPQDGDLIFTMQGWIDLDAARSPLLLGRMPETAEDLEAAFAVLLPGALEASTPQQVVELAEIMRTEVREAFAAALPMRSQDAAADDDGGDGFGDFAPILACLISQCGLSRLDALATPVAQAFVLIASHRRNQGWKVAGKKYAFRDLEAAPQPEGPSDV